MGVRKLISLSRFLCFYASTPARESYPKAPIYFLPATILFHSQISSCGICSRLSRKPYLCVDASRGEKYDRGLYRTSHRRLVFYGWKHHSSIYVTMTEMRPTLGTSMKGKESYASKLERQWDDLFQRLQNFHQKFGHCHVPRQYEEDPQLGAWLNTQRKFFRKGRLRQDRKERLESIGMEWGLPKHVVWDNMFNQLLEYRAEYDNCLVPRGYQQNPKLANWVQNQRRAFKNGTLGKVRRSKLKCLGFEWAPGSKPITANAKAQWETNFSELVQFQQLNGHCCVPNDHKPVSYTHLTLPTKA